MRLPIPGRRPVRPLAVAALAVSGILGLALPAAAHVTVSADDSARGAADSILTFRVPNEDDTASTVKVEIKFPVKDPIASVKPAVRPGWTVTTKTVTFDPPITTDDGTITSGVGEVVYTANTPADGIGAGQFATFQVLAGPLPDAASLTFPTVQTYSNGKTQSWVEPVTDPANLPESAAPVLTLTAAKQATSQQAPATAATRTSGTGGGSATTSGSDAAARTFGIIGTGLGALGVAVGVVGLRRRRPGTTS
ncbi:MAG TPA: YcnI family protein [Kineosporiaceae bacterium]|nr:YcnI family protein [Kineosporiaceae bacterium]